MYYPSADYFKQLEERLETLETENRSLKEQIEKGKEDLIKRLEQIKPVHIDNIHYKIQELSVKELKGTLNIGMTALSDPEELQKWIADTQEDGESVQLSDMEQPDDTDDETDNKGG